VGRGYSGGIVFQRAETRERRLFAATGFPHPSGFFGRETEETPFHSHKHIFFFLLFFNYLSAF
jgi:hypothetical protein